MGMNYDPDRPVTGDSVWDAPHAGASQEQLQAEATERKERNLSLCISAIDKALDSGREVFSLNSNTVQAVLQRSLNDHFANNFVRELDFVREVELPLWRAKKGWTAVDDRRLQERWKQRYDTTATAAELGDLLAFLKS